MEWAETSLRWCQGPTPHFSQSCSLPSLTTMGPETTPQETFYGQIISESASRWTQSVIALKSWLNCIRLPADTTVHHLTTRAQAHQDRIELPCVALSPKSPKRLLTLFSVIVLRLASRNRPSLMFCGSAGIVRWALKASRSEFGPQLLH